MDYVAAVALGFAGGVVGGMLGVGGGILFVPALTIFLGEPQIEAETTSLVAIVPVAIIGAWRQRGFGYVRLRDGIWIGVLSPVGVLIGVVVANAVSQWVLELSFAVLVLLIAAQLAYRALSGAPERP
jgi:uncharacterized membrane protein YfcA